MLTPGGREGEKETLEAQLLCAEAEFDLLLHLLGNESSGVSEEEVQPEQQSTGGASGESSTAQGLESGREAQEGVRKQELEGCLMKLVAPESICRVQNLHPPSSGALRAKGHPLGPGSWLPRPLQQRRGVPPVYR